MTRWRLRGRRLSGLRISHSRVHRDHDRISNGGVVPRHWKTLTEPASQRCLNVNEVIGHVSRRVDQDGVMDDDVGRV